MCGYLTLCLLCCVWVTRADTMVTANQHTAWGCSVVNMERGHGLWTCNKTTVCVSTKPCNDYRQYMTNISLLLTVQWRGGGETERGRGERDRDRDSIYIQLNLSLFRVYIVGLYKECT